ncbi:MAG: hypothetical protein RL375_2317 [Pseudomonadota bacterium]
MSDSNTLTSASPIWWRVPMVWLVIGGPAIVVLASFITLYLAISRPDPVLPTMPVVSAEGDEASKNAQATANAPAMVARNHAATGVR